MKKMAELSFLLIPGMLLFHNVMRKRQQDTAAYFLWKLLCLRLLVPVRIGLPVNVPVALNIYGMNSGTLSKFDRKISFCTLCLGQGRISMGRFLKTVWIIGAIFLLIRYGVIYFRLNHAFQREQAVEDSKIRRRIIRLANRNVRIISSEKISSPCTWGFIRPIIVLPADEVKRLEQEAFSDERCALIHECMHVRYRDQFWKSLMLITACLYWFNPFAWRMVRKFSTDTELECDRRVLQVIGTDQCEEYARMLLKCARIQLAKRERWTVSPFKDGEKFLKERVIRILNCKKTGKRSQKSVIIAGICILCATLFYPIASQINTKVEAKTNISSNTSGAKEAPDGMPVEIPWKYVFTDAEEKAYEVWAPVHMPKADYEWADLPEDKARRYEQMIHAHNYWKYLR